MSSSIVELLRSANQEIESLEKAFYMALDYKDDHPRDTVLAERMMQTIMDRVEKKSKEILEIYADYDGSRKRENEIFSGQRFVSDEQAERIKEQTGQHVSRDEFKVLGSKYLWL